MNLGLLTKEKQPFISRMGPCEDLLANPGFSQHVIDSGIVFAFSVLGISCFREDTMIEDFPTALRFGISLDVECLDYQIRVRGYLEPEQCLLRDSNDSFSRYTSFWSKTKHLFGWTTEETMMCMMNDIFKGFNRDYYYGDKSFVSFPAELLMVLDKRIIGDDYALEASFYTDDLVSVTKDEQWTKRAEQYALSF